MPHEIKCFHSINITLEMASDALTNTGKHVRSLCQTLNVRVASDKKNQFFDCFKWFCAFWHYIISHILSRPNINFDGPTNGLSIRQLSIPCAFSLWADTLCSWQVCNNNHYRYTPCVRILERRLHEEWQRVRKSCQQT